MKRLNLNAPKAEAILIGVIVAIGLFLAPTPPGFAIMVGIIIGAVALFVLDNGKKKR